MALNNSPTRISIREVPRFPVGARAVHRNYGIGTITAIEEKTLSTTGPEEFYLLIIADTRGAKRVLIPVKSQSKMLRDPLQRTQLKELQHSYQSPTLASELLSDVKLSWSARYAKLTSLLYSGSSLDLAKAIGTLNRITNRNFVEHRTLEAATSLLKAECDFAGISLEELKNDQPHWF